MKVSARQFWVLTIPFFLNDFLFILFQHNFYKFIVAEYGTRLLVIALFLYFLAKERDLSKSLGLVKLNPRFFFFLTTLLSVFCVWLDRSLDASLPVFISNQSLYQFPEFPNGHMKLIDLTFGLALVAFSEEIVFRGYLVNGLKERGVGLIATLLLSSLIFGLMHWAKGPQNVTSTFLWGLVPGYVVYKYKSIWPAIIAHYFTNLVVYGLYY